MKQILDLSGYKFGRLRVVECVGKDKNREYIWKCICDCGNEIISRGWNLRSGNKLSCGCLPRELTIERSTTHGLTSHPLYRVWSCMKDRCNNKNSNVYDLYGGRGITICDDWNDNFENFYNWSVKAGWKSGLQIDRINNNKGYSPPNCRFVTRKTNQINTRKSMRWVIGGIEYKSSTQAAMAIGVSHSTIQAWCGTIGIHGKEPKNKPGCYAYNKY